MSAGLARHLLERKIVSPGDLQLAIQLQETEQIQLVRAVLRSRVLTPGELDRALSLGPCAELRHIAPVPALIDRLPSGFCERLLAVPVRLDERAGLIDLVVADPLDGRIAAEFKAELKSEVRTFWASLATIDDVLDRMRGGEFSSSVIVRRTSRPPPKTPPKTPSRSAVARSDRPLPLVRPRDRVTTRRTGKELGASLDDQELGPSDIVEELEPTNLSSPERTASAVQDLQVPAAPLAPTFEADGAPDSGPLEESREARELVSSTFPSSPVNEEGPSRPSGISDSGPRSLNRDRIVQTLLLRSSRWADKVAIFLLKKGAFHGYASSSDEARSDSFKGVALPYSAPTCLRVAVEQGRFLGRLSDAPPHAELCAWAEGKTLGVFPVFVADRAALVVIATGIDTTTRAVLELEALADEAGDALTEVVVARVG